MFMESFELISEQSFCDTLFVYNLTRTNLRTVVLCTSFTITVLQYCGILPSSLTTIESSFYFVMSMNCFYT